MKEIRNIYIAIKKQSNKSFNFYGYPQYKNGLKDSLKIIERQYPLLQLLKVS